MQLEDKVGIVIITYNTSQLLSLQVDCIRKFCKDSYEIIIVDNSTILEEIKAIQYYCHTTSNIHLYKVDNGEKDFSKNHAITANWIYKTIKPNYDYILYLDHDCFPVKDFSVKEILGDNLIAGIPQGTTTKYMWPGCLFLDSQYLINDDIDFSCNSKLGLDTGGNLYKLIQDTELHKFLSEEYEYFNNEDDFYSMLHNKTFMHFIKGSNWNNNPDYENRMKRLIEILKEKAQI